MNRKTGEVFFSHTLTQLDFTQPEGPALLPLAEVAYSLQCFPWSEHPDLRVNRIDLASDHLVACAPRETCDRIADLSLPYCTTYRDPQDGEQPWLTTYHNGGRTKAPGVVAVHYPRLESLLHRHSDADAMAVAYCWNRIRQEVRFRGQGLRRRVGGGPMTAEAVFAAFSLLVEFAERRLRRVFEAGILFPPPRDLAGEAALAAAWGYEAPGQFSQFAGVRQ